MSSRALVRLRGLGWALLSVGLVTLLVAGGRPAPEGWALLLGLGLMAAGAVLVGLRYVLE